MLSLAKTAALTAILALAISATSAVSAPSPQDAASRIRDEIERLQKTVSAKPVADPDWKEAKPELTALLSQARGSLRADRLYLSLQELEQARSELRALEATKQPGAAQSGMPGFESAWKKASVELTAGNPPTRAGSASPVAFRALAETASGQTRVLLAASRSYAGATSPTAGLYYLGQAEGAAESARFCSSLPAPPLTAGRLGLPLRSVAPELRQLQERTVAAFTPPRSIERHGDFITLNATLKLAGELDAAGLYAGALYQYLDALQQFGRIDLPAPDDARKAAVRRALDQLEIRLRGSRRDDSLAELFSERAEGVLAGRRDRLPNPNDWRNAAVLVEQVLPAYFAWREAPAPQSPPAGHPIVVTLVRWPYT